MDYSRLDEEHNVLFVNILAVSAQRAFGQSLLELATGLGADGEVPSTHAVLEDARYGW